MANIFTVRNGWMPTEVNTIRRNCQLCSLIEPPTGPKILPKQFNLVYSVVSKTLVKHSMVIHLSSCCYNKKIKNE